MVGSRCVASVTHPEVVGFDLERAAPVKVRVYSISGRLVRVLHDGRLGAGHHSVSWDGTTDHGFSMKPGLYLCRLEAPAFSESRTLLLVR